MRAPQWGIAILFALVSLDAVIAYLLRGRLPFPINAIIPVLLVLLIPFTGARSYKPDQITSIFLCLAIAGLLIGLATVEGVHGRRIFRVAGAGLAFVIGYAGFHTLVTRKAWYWLIATIGAGTAIVAMLSLLKVAPSIFPSVDTLIKIGGKFYIRPSVYTDQNFQIFYLVYLAPLMVLARSNLEYGVGIVLAFASAYVLSEMQTRSGVLVFAGTFFLAGFVRIFVFRTSLKEKALVAIPLTIVVFGVTLWFAQGGGDGIVGRFTQADYASGYGRLRSLSYFFEKLADPSFWLPAGPEAFSRLSGGNYPHSNITAIYLEGGLVGIIGWLGIFVFPLIRLTISVAQRRCDLIILFVWSCGVGLMAAQLSLYVPTVDPLWLWGGVVAGAARASSRKRWEARSRMTAQGQTGFA